MKLIGGYKNGNYNCLIYDDGTKVRYNSKSNFIAEFPESIDMKISNKCDKLCPMCHENSEPSGNIADLNHPLLDSLHPLTELALGGGNIMTHPDLIPFLTRMHSREVICNMTVHQDHFMKYYKQIKDLVEADLIHGVGVSVSRPILEEEMLAFKSIPNVVIHLVAGVINEDVIYSLQEGNFKLLILGYKTYGRGIHYSQILGPALLSRIAELELNLDYIRKNFDSVSFDNLALSQLNMKDHVSKEIWDKCYMGNDGEFTMYVDLVEETFAASSTSTKYPIDSYNIDTLFKEVQKGE